MKREIVICDQCGCEINMVAPLLTERYPIRVTLVLYEEGLRTSSDMCSFACLAAWATKLDPTKNAKKIKAR